VSELPAGLPAGEQFGNGSKQAVNGFGDAAYGGPCPPEGEEHEYIFRLYALDAELGLEGGADAGDVRAALADHTLALSELAVVYGR
jgi:Raf kinase inhibitor-like YbhB/YbcL family protein